MILFEVRFNSPENHPFRVIMPDTASVLDAIERAMVEWEVDSDEAITRVSCKRIGEVVQ